MQVQSDFSPAIQSAVFHKKKRARLQHLAAVEEGTYHVPAICSPGWIAEVTVIKSHNVHVGFGVSSSEIYARKQADLYEEQQERLFEEQQAALCDSGLPDPDVCDVLQIPPVDMPILREAWSRGYRFAA